MKNYVDWMMFDLLGGVDLDVGSPAIGSEGAAS